MASAEVANTVKRSDENSLIKFSIIWGKISKICSNVWMIISEYFLLCSDMMHEKLVFATNISIGLPKFWSYLLKVSVTN